MAATASTERRSAGTTVEARLDISARSTSPLPSLGDAVTAPPSEIIRPHVLRRRLMLADAMAMFAGIGVAIGIDIIFDSVSGLQLSRHLALTAAAIPGFAVGAATNQLYRARANDRVADEMLNVVRTAVIGVAFLVLLAFAVKMKDLSRVWVALIGIWVTAALIIERSIARRIFANLRAASRVRRRILIVGSDAQAFDLRRLFREHPGLGYEAIGLVGDDTERGGDVLGPISDIDRILERHNASGVVVSPTSIPDVEINSLTRHLTDSGYHVTISSPLWDIDITRLRPQSIDGHSMIYIEPVARTGAPLIAKRLFDIVIASLMLVLAAPLMLGAAIAIKVTSRGPVFFRQTRVGRDGAPFTLVKLRTMVVDAESRLESLAHLNEADGPLFKIESDPRITPVGRVLRKLSIDELPQLTAVVRGTMSLVGPRPALPNEVAEWDDATRERLRVLPGLTGLWQVSGRSDASFESYKRLDLYYVDNWSLKHDLMICLRTVPVVLGGRGAH